MSNPDPKCPWCGFAASRHEEPTLLPYECIHSVEEILRAALIETEDQIRKLQDSANRRLDEYREVTALLREALTYLATDANSPCYEDEVTLLKRAEVMNLR